ncbi:MAG: hypothetical protein U1E05_04895, partial [Patescibacteria group bacterium]|nr:hypothetical protein [Patescibacteria group bacterium]
MNHRQFHFAVGFVVVVSIFGLLAAPAAAADPPELRYGFEADQEYHYDVTIVGEITDRTATHKGMLIYKCGKVTDSQFSLTTNGMLAESVTGGSTPHMPPRPRFGGPRWAFGQTGGTTFKRTGTMISTKSEEYLPFVLGLQEVLVIESLPEKPQPNWTAETDIAVVERMAAGPFFSRRFSSETQTAGKEQIKYNIVGQEDGIVRVRKVYSLQTVPDEGIVRFDMSGEGEFEFDTKRGIVQSLKMKYNIKLNEKNLTLAIPVSLEYAALSEAAMAERKQKSEEAMAAALEARKSKPLEPGEREALIAKLQSGNDAEVRGAAERLAKAIPTAQKDDVARALMAVANSRNTLTKKAVVQALAAWRVPEAEGMLIAALGDGDSTFVGRDVLAALAKLRTPAAAKAAAGSMTNGFLRSAAGEALAAMGPIAEEYTIPLLNDRDHWVRSEACEVLGTIGGEKSLPAVKHQLVEARDISETHNLKRAIDAINQRGGKPPVMPKEEEEVAEPAGPASDAISRTWHDATRSFQVEAKLVGV